MPTPPASSPWRLSFLAPAVLALACEVTAPDMSGTYSLVAYNDKAVPAVISSSGTEASRSVHEVLGWELVLDEHGAFEGRAVFRTTTDRQTRLDTTLASGSYEAGSGRVVFRSATGEVRTFAVGDGGDKLTSSQSPQDVIHGIARLDVLVFRKGRLGTVRQMGR